MAKSKLTPERIEKICNKIKMGLSYKDAALCSGISESAFYEWKARGEQQQTGKYRVFLESIKKANIQAETLHLKNINKCAFGGYIVEETRTTTDKEGIVTTTIIKKEIPGIWQASAWRLVVRFKYCNV